MDGTGCRRIVANRIGEGPCSSSVASKMHRIHRDIRTAVWWVGGRNSDREGPALFARLEDQRSANEGIWTTFRGGEIVQSDGASCARVATPTDCIVAVDSCARGEVTSHQCGLNGVRVGARSSFVPGRQTCF